MAHVKVGSARIDERGKAHGGKAGDQKSEVSTQNWYKHSKGWVLLRCKNALMRGYIADAMDAACDNSKIGYDQYQRLTLYNQVKDKYFDPAKATKACETDCSALVRVCVLYAAHKAGIALDLPNFTTPNEAAKLVATNLFDKITDTKYTTKSEYLKRGDILVTKTQGHTVVVLGDGAKAEPEESSVQTGDYLIRYGQTGSIVRYMQELLLKWNPACLPKYGADAEFGDETLKAVVDFQLEAGLETDGICGYATMTALEGWGKTQETETTEEPLYPVHGYIVDISQNQAAIDFVKLSGSVDFVIARACLSTKLDSKFNKYADGMEKYDIPYGAYLFTKAQSDAAAKDEAEALWEAVQGRKVRSLWIDVEGFKGKTCTAEERRGYVTTLVKHLRSLGCKLPIGMYTGQSRYNNSLGRIRSVFDLMWIATWGTNDGYLRKLPTADCELHQYTSYGNVKSRNKVPGIPGRVDLNRPAKSGALEALTGRKYATPAYIGTVRATKKATVWSDAQTEQSLGTAAKGTVWERRDGDVEGVYAIRYDGQDAFIRADAVKEG